MREKRRVVLVGCGMVGMSYAYAMLNQQTCDELVLIDYNKQKADGEAMDLNHGLAFSGSHMRIWSGTYEDCKDADIVTITAGVAQQPGETRLALLERNTAVFKAIIEPVTDSGFNGIFLIATNPVDVMTKITCELSGFNPKRVIGSGTSLDTARLRYLVGDYLKVDPRSIHGYVMGEHGDSSFIPTSHVTVGSITLREYLAMNHHSNSNIDFDDVKRMPFDAALQQGQADEAVAQGDRLRRAPNGDVHARGHALHIGGGGDRRRAARAARDHTLVIHRRDGGV